MLLSRPLRTLRPLHRRTFISSPSDLITTCTAMMQAVHATTSIPWFVLIPMTTVVFRTVFTLPLAILQRRRTQKQASLRPIVQSMGPILRLKLAQRAQTAKASESKNLSSEGQMIKGQAAGLTYEQIMLLSSKERRKRQKQLFKDHGCEMYKNFLLPMVQIPIWIAMSATIRDLTGWSDIGSNPMDYSLTTEGFAWITDLTVNDPLSVMPIVLGTLALINVEWNAKTMSLQNTHVRRSSRITPLDSILNLSRFGTVFLMAIATQAPVGLVEYWISSNTFSLLQNIVLDKYLPVRYQSEERWTSKEARDSEPLYIRK